MINPIFLIFSSIFILAISLFDISSEKENYKIKKEDFQNFKVVALKYSKYQTNYSNKEKTIKSIEQIIVSSQISKSNILQKNTSVVVKLNNLKTIQIHKFVNKILNKRFNITKFEINTNNIILEIGII